MWLEDITQMREARREEERSYRGDVEYEVWRAGRNPDNVDSDRVDDLRERGYSREEAAQSELHRMSHANDRLCEEPEEQEEQGGAV